MEGNHITPRRISNRRCLLIDIRGPNLTWCFPVPRYTLARRMVIIGTAPQCFLPRRHEALRSPSA